MKKEPGGSRAREVVWWGVFRKTLRRCAGMVNQRLTAVNALPHSVFPIREPGSGDQQHAADRLAAFDVGVGGGGLGEREGAVDDHLQLAARRLVDQPLDVVVHAVGGDLGAQEDALRACGCRPSGWRRRRSSARARPRRPSRPGRDSRGDRIEPCRVEPPTESTTRLTPLLSVRRITSWTHVVGRVVDAVVQAERLQLLEPLVARGGGQHRRARRAWPAGWRRRRRREAPAWTSTVSPAFRWPNSNRQSSAVPNATGMTEASLTSKPSGITQAVRAGTARSSACEPKAPVVTTLSPTLQVGDLRADLDDLAGGLVADDVRLGDQRRRPGGSGCRRPRC